jgi:hypothetical protein
MKAAAANAGAVARASAAAAPSTVEQTQQASAHAAAAATTNNACTAAATNGEACIICLDTVPPPIQSRCGCRGDAGFAHVDCRITAATYKQQSTGSTAGWELCSTCGQNFTGPMALGLAEGLLRRSEARESLEKLSDWLVGAELKCNELFRRGESAAMEAFCRKALSVCARFAKKRVKIKNVGNFRLLLGEALADQGKHDEAHSIFEQCVAENVRLLGVDHITTLNSTIPLCTNLGRRGKLDEAVAIFQDTLERFKRVKGPEDEFTINCALHLAAVFMDFQDPRYHLKALDLYKTYYPIIKRACGPEHVDTLTATRNYAMCVAACGQPDAAEVLLVETVAGMARVFGSNHPFTRGAMENLAFVRDAVHADTTLP